MAGTTGTATDVAPRSYVSPASAAPVGPTAGTAAAADGSQALVSLRGITKAFGPTLANEDVDLRLAPGEVLGLVGANGAGKSTLMRILTGNLHPDTGDISIVGNDIAVGTHSPSRAHAMGVRIVHQELSLCSNLTVAENFYLEHPGLKSPPLVWRSTYRDLARKSIDRIFPNANIDLGRSVGDLSIGDMQMVEIARAASAPGLAVLVLDEPTSSLDSDRSRQLRAYIRQAKEEGLGIIFISHKLAEVIDIADRVIVMRNGRVSWKAETASATVDDLVSAMGGSDLEAAATKAREHQRVAAEGEPVITVPAHLSRRLGRTIELKSGEIVGLAGLDGSGQKPLLQTLLKNHSGRPGRGPAATYVSGDRQREGVFSLWTVLSNISLGRIAKRMPLSPISLRTEREKAREAADWVALDAGRFDAGILDLSGGNQQKALVARGLVGQADVMLLDDPTRGVDISSKREFYKLFRQSAEDGRLVVWYSTEDVEFLECDRVLVMHEGEIVRELTGDEITEEAIVDTSFAHAGGGGEAASGRTTRQPVRWAERAIQAVPFLALVAVFATMISLNPLVASSFGLDLLLGPAVALVLLAFAQMFIVGGSEIDLGVGAFAGLVNVVSATLLVSAPALGGLALLGGIAGYGLMALLIQKRQVPAIVVTLGAAFVWTGCGQTIQPTPGGSSPVWLSAMFNWSLFDIPTPVILILLASAAAILIDRSKLGTVLRGFGNSTATLQRSGWSALRYGIGRYLIAGTFAALAGLTMTAANSASDINAGSTFTLLTVAAVVIGGCQLLGGRIEPAGVAAGAVTLALIGALLGFLGVSTDYNAAVQGTLLIAMLALRLVVTRRRQNA